MGTYKPRATCLIDQASILVAALGAAVPASAMQELRGNDRSDDPIIIIGQRNAAGLRADSEIDAAEVDSYGVDTVGDLLATIGRQIDPGDEGPVILINGNPVSGIDEVADLPTEAVAKLQLLSRDAAGTLGQRPTRRVINVVIRPDHRQVTLGSRGRVATAGGGGQAEGSANGLRLDKGNRRSLALRFAATDRLDESDRDIVSAPEDAASNRFKSLIGSSLVASANGNVTQKLGRSLLSLNVRGEWQENHARTGALAIDPDRPLVQDGQTTSLNAAASANGPLGEWRYGLIANLGWRLARTSSDRDTVFDPLALLSPDVVVRDRVRSRTITSGLSATLNGSAFSLPAGKAHAALRLEWRGLSASRMRSGSDLAIRRNVRRDDLAGQLTLRLPLLADGAIGELGAELSGALRHVTGSGAVHDLGTALNWRPADRLSFRAAINREQIAPASASLTDPVVTVDNVRVFDFIRQETVAVTYVTGGNPDLDVARRRTIAVGANWQPIERVNLNLSIDYMNNVGRGAFAALPPVNADVQAAFPDRFQRDASGRLIAVDARPVAFDRVRQQSLRTGATFFHSFGKAGAGSGSADDDNQDRIAPGRALRVNGFFNHEWTLRSDRLARAGLPVVDLLDGGALGSGGGQPRHAVQFGGGMVRGGIGLNIDGSWTGASTIASGSALAPDELRFAAQTLIDARLFANLGTLMPARAWARGLRITVAADNLFDSKRRVRDSSGATPLGYQPYLLDPLGRTVSLSLRKVL